MATKLILLICLLSCLLQLAAIKLARYGEDLLFYLYYMNGGDLLQLLAAVELWVLPHIYYLLLLSSSQCKWFQLCLVIFFQLNFNLIMWNLISLSSFNRDWRYHKEERVWITRAPGMEPTLKTNAYERGTYYFFDCLNWRKVAKVRLCLSAASSRQYINW